MRQGGFVNYKTRTKQEAHEDKAKHKQGRRASNHSLPQEIVDKSFYVELGLFAWCVGDILVYILNICR